MLLLKMFAESNAKIVALSLETERVCRVNLNYTTEECAALDDGNNTRIQVRYSCTPQMIFVNHSWFDCREKFKFIKTHSTIIKTL